METSDETRLIEGDIRSWEQGSLHLSKLMRSPNFPSGIENWSLLLRTLQAIKDQRSGRIETERAHRSQSSCHS